MIQYASSNLVHSLYITTPPLALVSFTFVYDPFVRISLSARLVSAFGLERIVVSKYTHATTIT
jgi:hypothetical protein